MIYRTLTPIVTTALLVAAVVSLNAPPLVWNPSWTMRLTLAGVGVVLGTMILLFGRSNPGN